MKAFNLVLNEKDLQVLGAALDEAPMRLANLVLPLVEKINGQISVQQTPAPMPEGEAAPGNQPVTPPDNESA